RRWTQRQQYGRRVQGSSHSRLLVQWAKDKSLPQSRRGQRRSSGRTRKAGKARQRAERIGFAFWQYTFLTQRLFRNVFFQERFAFTDPIVRTSAGLSGQRPDSR